MNFATGMKRLGAFLWKYKWAVLVFLFFVLGVGLLRGCDPILGKSRGQLELETELAQSETETQQDVNARDAELSQIAADMRVLRNELRHLSERGYNEIAAATPANEAPLDPALVAAWRGAVDRLRLYPRADGAGPDSDRPGS